MPFPNFFESIKKKSSEVNLLTLENQDEDEDMHSHLTQTHVNSIVPLRDNLSLTRGRARSTGQKNSNSIVLSNSEESNNDDLISSIEKNIVNTVDSIETESLSSKMDVTSSTNSTINEKCGDKDSLLVQLESQKMEQMEVEDSPSVTEQDKKRKRIKWMLLALLSHTGWGVYPVLARYLQNVEKLPTFSLLISGNAVVAIVSLILVLYRKKFLNTMKSKILPLLILTTVVRVVTNVLGPKYTYAVNVQLMTLLSPLIVAVLNFFITKDPLPPYTITAVIFCTIGSIMMLMSSVFPFKFNVTHTDWIGIGCALISAFFLSLYMVLVKKTVSSGNNVRSEDLLFFLTAPVVVLCAVSTVGLGENWSTWRHLSLEGWGIWALFTFGVILFGNFLQIASIENLGAPMVSTLLAFRLVAALVFSAIIMDEELSDIYQFIGAVLVLLTVTLYMWVQKRNKK